MDFTRISVFLFLCYLSLPHLLPAQNISRFIYTDTVSLAFDTNGNNIIPNQMLKEIALSKGSSPLSERYAIPFSLLIERNNSAGAEKYSARVCFDRFKNDPFYKGFNISDYLIPSGIQFILYLLDDQGVALKTFENCRSLNNLEKETENGIQQLEKWNIVNAEPLFLSGDKEEFDYYLEQISQYYAVSGMIDTVFSIFYEIDKKEEKEPHDLLLKLIELRHMLGKIKSFSFWHELPVTNDNDRLSLMRKTDQLDYRYITTSKDYHKYLKNSDKIKPDVNPPEILKDYIRIFTKHNETNGDIIFSYKKFYNYLAEPEYSQNKLFHLWNLIHPFITKLQSSLSTREIQSFILQNIYTYWIGVATQYADESRFLESEDAVRAAERLCLNSGYVHCSEDLFHVKAKIRYGMYDSYLTIGDRALRSGNLNMADKYLALAQEYQQSNKTYLISNKKALALYETLFQNLIEKAQYEYLNESPDLALSTLDYLLSNPHFKKISEIKKDSISKAVNTIKNNIYSKWLRKAGNTLETDLRLSRKTYAKALELEKEFGDILKPDPLKDSLSNIFDSIKSYEATKKDSAEKITRRDHLIDKIKLARVKVWGNEIPEALSIKKQCIDMAQEKNLADDSIFKAEIHALDTLIITRKCFDAELRTENLKNRGITAIKENDFPELAEIIPALQQIYSENPGCNPDCNVAQQWLDKYKYPIQYARKAKELDRALKKKEYDSYITIYDELNDMLRKNPELSNYVAKPEPLAHTIIRSRQKQFCFKGLDYYIRRQDIPPAIKLLKELQNNGVSSRETKTIQLKAGKTAAASDHQSAIQSVPCTQVSEYTGNDPWFKYFTKSYRKVCKELAEESKN